MSGSDTQSPFSDSDAEVARQIVNASESQPSSSTSQGPKREGTASHGGDWLGPEPELHAPSDRCESGCSRSRLQSEGGWPIMESPKSAPKVLPMYRLYSCRLLFDDRVVPHSTSPGWQHRGRRECSQCGYSRCRLRWASFLALG